MQRNKNRARGSVNRILHHARQDIIELDDVYLYFQIYSNKYKCRKPKIYIYKMKTKNLDLITC